MLREAGLAKGMSLRCPGRDITPHAEWTAGELRNMPLEQYQPLKSQFSGCYAYALGFWDHGEIQVYRQCEAQVPLLSDLPPETVFNGANSPNHGGRGQNVLFTDGHAIFLTTRFILDDDLFLNRHNEVRPGVDEKDCVLAPSATPLQ